MSSFGWPIIIDRVDLAKQGDNGISSVRPSVRLCVGCVSVYQYQSSCVCLCVCDQWAHAGNCADAVDRLLILKYT